MKKRLTGVLRAGSVCLCLCLCLAGSVSMHVRADGLYGSSGWEVSLTSDNKMKSNFETSEINDTVSGLQPGDTITFTIALANNNAKAADWYMSNKVRSAMEENGGGAYSYDLVYRDENGQETVLFSNDRLGGEGETTQGLQSATAGLEEYFYLDTLKTGQKGTVSLKIGLDGESQGNAYQTGWADMQMQFAVELTDNNGGGSGSSGGSGSGSSGSGGSGSGNGSGSTQAQIVKTGDEANAVIWILGMGASGLLFLLLGFYTLSRNRKEEG